MPNLNRNQYTAWFVLTLSLPSSNSIMRNSSNSFCSCNSCNSLSNSASLHSNRCMRSNSCLSLVLMLFSLDWIRSENHKNTMKIAENENICFGVSWFSFLPLSLPLLFIYWFVCMCARPCVYVWTTTLCAGGHLCANVERSRSDREPFIFVSLM